jgi:hypothetical protein
MARAIFSSCTATSDTVSDSKVMRMLGGLQYKGNLQDDLVCDDLVVPDSDFLLLAPCTLNLTKRLRRSGDALDNPVSKLLSDVELISTMRATDVMTLLPKQVRQARSLMTKRIVRFGVIGAVPRRVRQMSFSQRQRSAFQCSCSHVTRHLQTSSAGQTI